MTPKSASNAKAIKTKPVKATKSIAVKRPSTGRVKRQDVSEVKKSNRSKNMVDLRQKAQGVGEEPVKNILAVHKKAAPMADLPTFKLPTRTAEKLEDKEAARVEHFDWDQKIDFKRSRNKPLHIYRKIFITFLLLTIPLLLAILYFYLVKVDISVTLKKEQAKGYAVVSVVNSNQAGSSTDKSILGIVKEIDVEQTKTFAATGKQILGSEVKGRVRIVNNNVRNQPLVANSRLLSDDNQLVYLKNTINIPAGSKVEADVYSTEATSSINISTGTRLSFPGLKKANQEAIYAEALEPISYQEKAKLIVSLDDLANVESAMKLELDNKVKNEFLAEYQNQYAKVLYKLLDETMITTADAKAGEEKNSFNVKATAKVAIVAFSDQSALRQAEDQLMVQLPSNKSVINFDQAAATYELGNVDTLAGTAAVNIGYSAAVVSKSQNIIDKGQIIGLTAGQLETYLRGKPEILNYTVNFTPSFIGRVPYLLDRISINVSN